MLSSKTYGTTPPGHSLLLKRKALENSPLTAPVSKGGRRISFSIMATSSACGSDEKQQIMQLIVSYPMDSVIQP